MSQHSGMNRRPSGLPVERPLDKAAESVTSLPPQLDLVHVTAAGHGRNILISGKIETRHCNVFGKDLVYAFIGRPAYHLRGGDEKSDHMSQFPMVFVICPDRLEAPYHVYPFDTGAASSGTFAGGADPHVALENYELTPDLSAARRHIAWAFGDNRSYYDGVLREGVEQNLAGFQWAERSFFKIVSLPATGRNRPDERASAIEIAYSRHIELRGNVRLVIMPQQFIEDGGRKNDPIISILKDLNISWKLYDWRPNESPNFYLDNLNSMVCEWLESEAKL
jgi:hypothetical protein